MLALLAAITVAATPQTVVAGPRASVLSSPPTAACKANGTYQAGWNPALAQRGGRVQAQRLDQLPKANLEIAVERSVGGCAAPVIVRYSVGR